jgi:hypothetical protein
MEAWNHEEINGQVSFLTVIPGTDQTISVIGKQLKKNV